MKKSKIILATCCTLVAMLVNFIFAIIFHGENGANIFTTVSGWVSGVATIVLGLIAIKINAKYKEENDEFLKKQEEMFWKNEKKTIVELYREQVIKCYNIRPLNWHFLGIRQRGFAIVLRIGYYLVKDVSVRINGFCVVIENIIKSQIKLTVF